SSIAFATRLPWSSLAKTFVRASRRTAGPGAGADAGRWSGVVPGSAETAVGLRTANRVLGLGPEEATRRGGAVTGQRRVPARPMPHCAVRLAPGSSHARARRGGRARV